MEELLGIVLLMVEPRIYCLSLGKTWVTTNFLSNPTISAQNYYIMWWDKSPSQAGTTCIYYTSTGGTGTLSNVPYVAGTDNWPANLSLSANAYKFSIYCTYTASGGTSITNSPLQFGDWYISEKFNLLRL